MRSWEQHRAFAVRGVVLCALLFLARARNPVTAQLGKWVNGGPHDRDGALVPLRVQDQGLGSRVLGRTVRPLLRPRGRSTAWQLRVFSVE